MMRYFKYILIVVLAISCNNNSIEKPKKPKNLIQKDKMADIIFDMSIFTAAKGVNKKIIESNGILPEDYIYKKYDIDSSQFAQSNEYYAFNIESYEEIYSKVKERLEAKKVYYDSVIDAEAKQRIVDGKEFRKRRDSINGLRVEGNKTEFKSSVNLFDVTEIVDGEYVSNTGDVLSAKNWGRTGYIRVIPGTSYRVLGSKGRHGLAFFNDKTGIAMVGSFNGSTSLPLNIVAPTGAKYCVFNLYNPTNIVYTNVQFVMIKKANKKIDFSKERPTKMIIPNRVKKADSSEQSIRQ